MALRINNNISSINGQRNLIKNDQMLARSLEKLSSGLKINRAADNAAGLVISEQMRAQIKGIAQATSNSETAVNMVQSAEGALDEVSSLLTKARELTLHASNEGANDTNQLAADQAEMDNVIKAVTRIGEQTQFGTKKLLDGSLNGATTISDSAKLSRVRVGNLANNTAITVGTVNLAVTAGTKESTTLKTTVTGSNSYIFTAAVSGVKMGTTAKLKSGSTATMTINGTSFVYTAGTGGALASKVASGLNAHASKPAGYTITADADGQLKVERNGLGSTDFTSSITFARGATAGAAAVAGTKESVTATVRAASGTAGTAAAAVLFSNASSPSGVATSSTFARSGVVLTAKVTTTTGGSFSATYTVSGTDKSVSKALSGLQTALRSAIAAGSSLKSGNLTLAAGITSGMSVKFERSRNAVAADDINFNFTLEIDNPNNPTLKSEIHFVTMDAGTYATGAAASTTFTTGGTSGLSNAGAMASGTRLMAGRGLTLTINGVSKTVLATGANTLAGGSTMVQMAAKLQTAFSADGIKVAWATNGAVYSTGTSAASGQTSAALTKTGAALTAAAAGFVIYNATGDQITNISLTVDQASGGNVAATVAEVRNGSNAALVYDLDTTAQTRAQYVIAVASGASTAAQTKSSNSGSTTVNGADVQATLTTATGKVINLKSTTAVTGSVINLGLTTGSQADGFQGVSLSISNAYAVAGGQTSFKLTNGAEFQIGANEGQKAGITIDAVTASELGRNVSGAGTLESLEDLLSTKKSALTAGLTSEALKVIDAAIDEVTNQRGKMGAFQGNTLETNLNSLRVSSENLTAAESVIRDTDYAAESARFTRNQILVQASQSMLAQANQLPQSVLQLLQ